MTTPEAMAEYAKLSGKAGTRQLNQDFRIKWAQTQLNSRCLERNTKSDTMKESWGEDGAYMTFDRIVIKKGGLQNNNAVVRAVKYTLAALKAGPPYISGHPWKGGHRDLVC